MCFVQYPQLPQTWRRSAFWSREKALPMTEAGCRNTQDRLSCFCSLKRPRPRPRRGFTRMFRNSCVQHGREPVLCTPQCVITMLLVAVCPHPQGRPADTAFINVSLTGDNKTAELQEAIRSAVGLANEPPIFVRQQKPGDCDEHIYAAIPYTTAVDWLITTAGQPPPDGDTRYQDGCPALWVKVPAHPTATGGGQGADSARSAQSQPDVAVNNPTPISNDPGSTAQAAGRRKSQGAAAAAAGGTDIWVIGPASESAHQCTH